MSDLGSGDRDDESQQGSQATCDDQAQDGEIPGLTLFDLNCPPRKALDEIVCSDSSGVAKDSTLVVIPVDVLEKLFDDDFKCRVCLGLLDNTWAVTACLHRFCSNCIQRTANILHSCPFCRTKLPSRRASKPDDVYEKLKLLLFSADAEGGASPRWDRKSSSDVLLNRDGSKFSVRSLSSSSSSSEALMTANKDGADASEVTATINEEAHAAETPAGAPAPEQIPMQEVDPVSVGETRFGQLAVRSDGSIDLEQYRSAHLEKVREFQARSQALQRRTSTVAGRSRSSGLTSAGVLGVGRSGDATGGGGGRGAASSRSLHANRQSYKEEHLQARKQARNAGKVWLVLLPHPEWEPSADLQAYLQPNDAFSDKTTLYLQHPYLKIPPTKTVADLRNYLLKKLRDCSVRISALDEGNGRDLGEMSRSSISNDQGPAAAAGAKENCGDDSRNGAASAHEEHNTARPNSDGYNDGEGGGEAGGEGGGGASKDNSSSMKKRKWDDGDTAPDTVGQQDALLLDRIDVELCGNLQQSRGQQQFQSLEGSLTISDVVQQWDCQSELTIYYTVRS